MCNESYGVCVRNKNKGKVNIDDMQFGFRPGNGTTDVIFTVMQMQKKT